MCKAGQAEIHGHDRGMTGIWPCDGHVVMSSFAAFGCILYHGLMSISKPAVFCRYIQQMLDVSRNPCWCRSKETALWSCVQALFREKWLTELWWLQWPFPLSCNKTFAESLLLSTLPRGSSSIPLVWERPFRAIWGCFWCMVCPRFCYVSIYFLLGL